MRGAKAAALLAAAGLVLGCAGAAAGSGSSDGAKSVQTAVPVSRLSLQRQEEKTGSREDGQLSQTERDRAKAGYLLNCFWLELMNHGGFSADLSSDVKLEQTSGQSRVRAVMHQAGNIEQNLEGMHLVQNLGILRNGTEEALNLERWLVRKDGIWTAVQNSSSSGWKKMDCGVRQPQSCMPDMAGLLAQDGYLSREEDGVLTVTARLSAGETACALGAVSGIDALGKGLRMYGMDRQTLAVLPDAEIIYRFDEKSEDILSMEVDLSEAWRALSEKVTEDYDRAEVMRASGNMIELHVEQCRVTFSDFVFSDQIRPGLPAKAALIPDSDFVESW